MRLFYLSFFALLVQTSIFAQYDRGCSIYSYFSVVYKPNSDNYKDVELEYDMLFTYIDTTDTITIELLPGNSMVVLRWYFYDEVFDCHDMGKNIEWYNHDSIVSDDLYEHYYQCTVGGCGEATKAGTTLSTQEPGLYQMKLTDYPSTYFPIVRIEHKIFPPEPVYGKTNFHIYPNPVNEIMTIDHGKITNGQIHIHNVQGKLVSITTLDSISENTLLDISKLSQGLYIATIYAAKEQQFQTKFIKL